MIQSFVILLVSEITEPSISFGILLKYLWQSKFAIRLLSAKISFPVGDIKLVRITEASAKTESLATNKKFIVSINIMKKYKTSFKF